MQVRFATQFEKIQTGANYAKISIIFFSWKSLYWAVLHGMYQVKKALFSIIVSSGYSSCVKTYLHSNAPWICFIYWNIVA